MPHTEWLLLEHDERYVLGKFCTHSMAAAFNRHTELNVLLAEWKRDRSALHCRVDLSADSTLFLISNRP